MSKSFKEPETIERTADPPRASRRRSIRGLKLVAIGSLIALIAAVVAILRRPVEPDRLLQDAQDAYRAGRYDRAESLLDRLGARREPIGLDRLLRAQVDLATERPEAARDELERIPKDHPVAPLSLVLLGQVEMKLGHIPAAERAYQGAVKLEPRSVQARRELAFIYSLQRRFEDLDQQLAALSGLGDLDPEYLLHWSKIRSVAWNFGQDRAHLERAVAADPSDRWSRLTLAEGYRRAGELERAERILEPLPRSDPERTSILASIALDRGSIEQADVILDEATIEASSVARLRGELALMRGDPESALADLKHAERGGLDDRRLLDSIARSLILLDRAEEAEPYLDLIRSHDALGRLVSEATTQVELSDAELCYKIGSLCLILGRQLEARAWFEAAIADDPLHDGAQAALTDLGAIDYAAQ